MIPLFFNRAAIPVHFFIIFRDWADHFAGIADCHRVARDVFDDHAPSADHNITADRDSGHHLNSATNPHIVPDRDRVGILKSLISALRIDRMTCRVESAVRRNEYIVPKRHFCTVQNDQIVVGKEILTDLNMIPVIAEKRRQNVKGLFCLSKKLLYDRLLLCLLCRTQVVVLIAQFFRVKSLRFQFLIIVRIDLLFSRFYTSLQLSKSFY